MERFYSNRIKKLPTSIFAKMSKLAFEYQAVNLGQGFPDFDGPEWMPEKAYEAMKAGKNQYAPSPGIYSLRKQISVLHKKHYGLNWDPDKNILISTGATEALYTAFQAFVNPGDEVIVFEPFYDAYQSDIILSGGIPKYVTLHKPNFEIDFNELENAITDKTKLLVLNNPHNPTGKVFSENELKEIAKICIKNDILVISDEVYEFLTFDGNKHIPIINLDNMADRTLTISSTGKTFGMTGWKVGFLTGHEKLISAVQKVRQWSTFAVNTPAQHAMTYGFSIFDEYLPEFHKVYQAKKDYIINELKDSAYKIHNPGGSYFLMVDIPRDKFSNDVEAAEKLVREFGVATIPPSVFYEKSEEGSTMLRLCFAKKEETLKEGVRRLKLI